MIVSGRENRTGLRFNAQDQTEALLMQIDIICVCTLVFTVIFSSG